MRRIFFILTLLSVGWVACGQSGTGWFLERRKVNFRDSTYFAKDANFYGPFRLGGTAVTSNAAELNILDGALVNYVELNHLVGTTSSVQTQLNAKQATLVSGTTLKTVNGETLLGAGNIVIEGGEGGSMTYPGAGIALSTGTEWATSLTDNHAQWDTAYVASGRWTGGAISLVPATGRTSLGGTTVGQNLFTLTNPDAIRFIRLNADNTVTALSAANFKTALSFTATDVSLGNVTNESKTTMFSSPTFTTKVTLPATISIAPGGVLSFNTGEVPLTLTHSSNTLTLGGGNLALGTNNLTLTGSIGATGARATKGWFTDLEVTNSIAGNLAGTAATVTGFTRNAGTLTLSGGHGLTFTTTGLTSLILPTSGTLAANPMTTAGDVIIGGASGVPSRLAATTDGYILTLSGGSPVWAAATGGEAIEARIDSIVTVLSDTINIEELLLFDVDTDTLATQDYARGAINDTMTAIIAAATVGVAAVDSNIYAGYTTRTYVESLLGSGSGLSAERLPFIIGTTSGAPTTADSTVTHANISGKHIDLYRDGAKQYQNFTTTNTAEGFRVSGSTITVNPLWQDGEQVLVDIIQPILWSYLSLEGEESSLLTGLSAYWKLDETSGTTATDATETQNGTLMGGASRTTGKIGNGVHIQSSDHVVRVPYNTDVSPKGSAFSIGFWVYLDSLPSATGRDGYLAGVLNSGSPTSVHEVYIPYSGSNANKVMFYTRNTSGTGYVAVSTSTLSAETWYNIVVVNNGDGEEMQIYINGSDDTSASNTFSGTAYEGLSYVGFGNGYYGCPAYVPNIIDECSVWSKALSSDEVTEWYNSGTGKTHPFN